MADENVAWRVAAWQRTITELTDPERVLLFRAMVERFPAAAEIAMDSLIAQRPPEPDRPLAKVIHLHNTVA